MNQKQPLDSASKSDQCQGLSEHNDHPSPAAMCCPSGFHYKTERYVGRTVASNSGITAAHRHKIKSNAEVTKSAKAEGERNSYKKIRIKIRKRQRTKNETRRGLKNGRK